MLQTPDRLDPEVVIFDFDGVIIDSVPTKNGGFAILYGIDDAETEERMRQTIWRNGGLSRFKMLAILEREMFGRNPGPAEIDDLARRYAEIVDPRVPDCALIAGAETVLDRLDGTPCHLVSGTPHEVLMGTVRAKGLERHFRSITGSPNVKAEVFARIVAAGGHDPARSLAIGDSLTELEAARKAGMAFVGVVSEGLPNPFPPDVTVVGDLHGLAQRL
ncbi:HAD family hydrolase [Azospirillum brasilense]|uniref:HAD family hydrolase n=1 Tax=Azospirillum brasilense TaxID=192 RepID=UPI000E684B18|nr:HAD family phosphatase [Azospirillum brasilense]NUB28570.1 HAD hydrolase-like protein [Azospirillum brasilense]NUB34684.1 HAD hydrolase-like protein [Azospirillum brasilense]RIV94793.1 HAD family phosphatase [Azospirillum brasilense]